MLKPGKIRPLRCIIPHPTARFCPLKATSLLVAGESEFWHRQTVSNSTVYSAFFRVRKWNLHPSLDGDDFWSSERGWLHITDVPVCARELAWVAVTRDA